MGYATKLMFSRCPNCQTTFKVSTPQLEAADGLVRCGNCMTTFSAPEHKLADGGDNPEANNEAQSDSAGTADDALVTESWLAQLLPEPTESDDAPSPAAAQNNHNHRRQPGEPSRREPTIDSYPKLEMLQRIAPEPIAINPKRQLQPLQWLRAGMGTLCCTLLLALLAMQWFVREPDRWPALTTVPGLAWACQYYPCQMQGSYSSEQLAVYSHPDEGGVLVVEAVISNNSAIALPYPELALQFTDLENRPVAQRQFSPADYLRGEASGARQMPPATPVRIALTIRDPGPGAVNYSLELIALSKRS